ncbi:FAD-dependent oxidoreductase [Poseidonibacter lekithochrous]|uniref:FAD-dependent oxidoreductase n=1 Tax=Poseidonibacter lekithochrous TaxID=1904463 RepID=UPI0008FC3C22|nr:FAD-dependent oxidoreductase [Poseidonibacter lekithochrous]QKJ22990.1 NAD(P)/FAD-dependent oxidoreductase [Poseidonibacter lekithochrous]
MQRRDFFKLSIFTASILVSTKIDAIASTTSNSKTNILILGGGFAGISTAKYLKELNPNLNVTLIEKNLNFISCPFSNGWLGGIKDITFESLNFDYNSSVIKYNYNFLNETVVNINRDKKEVITNKSVVKYDYMIMALGIDYNYKKIFKRDKQKAKEALIKAPAGLKPGSEIIRLKKMITDFKGGNFILTLPKSSYKCPPAPYERACMIANYFKENKIDGKVVIIDPRAKPASKAKAYLEAFSTIYKDYIVYTPNTRFKDVDFSKKEILIKKFDELNDKYITSTLKYEELSIIPPNKANDLYKKAGIKTYAQGWVKLKRPTFRTVSDDDIYVIGDAQGEYPYPKSGQMANSCALILAKELIERINKKEFDYKSNLPGNVCYSIIAPNKAAWVSHEYKYEDKLRVYAQSSDITSDNYLTAKNWYTSITSDLFGI